MVAGCQYKSFPDTPYRDSQLTCTEIDQEMAETEKVIARKGAGEFDFGKTAAVAAGAALGIHSEPFKKGASERSLASAERRKQKLLELRRERCGE